MSIIPVRARTRRADRPVARPEQVAGPEATPRSSWVARISAAVAAAHAARVPF